MELQKYYVRFYLFHNMVPYRRILDLSRHFKNPVMTQGKYGSLIHQRLLQRKEIIFFVNLFYKKKIYRRIVIQYKNTRVVD